MALPFHVEQPIAAPPDVVWAFLTSFRNTRLWMEGTTEVVELTPGPIGVGSCYRQTRTIGGRAATVVLEVRAMDADARTILLEADGRRSSLGRGVFRFRYAVEAGSREGTARLVLDGEIDALGRAVELVASFFVSKFVRVVARDLDALRACVEGETLGERGAPAHEEPRAADPSASRLTTSSTSRAPST